MKAFRLAIEKGYGIELDVQLSADGIPVVFHDATLTRVCGVNRRVCDLTLSELKQLSLGGKDFPDTGERIPTFAEFLKLVDGRVPLIVEIKMEKWDARVRRPPTRCLKVTEAPTAWNPSIPACWSGTGSTAPTCSGDSSVPIL